MRRLASLLVLAALLLLPACGETTPPVTPKALAIVGGDGQSGEAGTELSVPLEVQLTGSDDQPMSGVPVQWAVSAGTGTASASGPTDANGRASARLRLGQRAEPHGITASVDGVSPVSFTATATAGPPSVLELATGGDQTGTVGAALAQPVAVRVKDSFGNLVAGVVVAFAAETGGSFNPSQATTSADGLAQSTWTLGTTAGAQTATASVASAAAVRTTIKATAGAASPSTMEAASGSGQTGTVGAPLSHPIVVRLKDTYGNLVSGVAIAFSAGGGGSVSPAQASTDAQGQAQTTWTLGTTAGSQTASASVPSATTISAVGFSATAKAGPAHSIEAVSGTGQSMLPGYTLQDPLVFRVKDQYGNAQDASTVAFTTGNGGSFDPAQTTTDTEGKAQTKWTLGPKKGTQTATATVTGVAPFSVTAEGDPCDWGLTHSIGSSVNGSLAGDEDCEYSGGYYADLYIVTVDAATSARFTLTSSAFDAFLDLYRWADGKRLAWDNYDDAAGTENAALRILMPAGKYNVFAESYDPGETGAYTFASSTYTSAVTGCNQDVWIVPGVQTDQELTSTDCASGGWTYDDFFIYLQAGQQITIDLTSSAFDGYLFLLDWDGNVLAEDDDSGGGTNPRITYTAPTRDSYWIDLTSYTAGETGAYKLSVTDPAQSSQPRVITVRPGGPTHAVGMRAGTEPPLREKNGAFMGARRLGRVSPPPKGTPPPR